jgi:hypothetical protein
LNLIPRLLTIREGKQGLGANENLIIEIENNYPLFNQLLKDDDGLIGLGQNKCFDLLSDENSQKTIQAIINSPRAFSAANTGFRSQIKYHPLFKQKLREDQKAIALKQEEDINKQELLKGIDLNPDEMKRFNSIYHNIEQFASCNFFDSFRYETSFKLMKNLATHKDDLVRSSILFNSSPKKLNEKDQETFFALGSVVIFF